MKAARLNASAGIVFVTLGLAHLGCGSSSGPVLERVDPRVPPRWRLRADVFFVNDVVSCAIGRPCSRDLDTCFALSGAGTPLYFEPNGIQFVSPGDERIASADQSGCFRLALDADVHAAVSQALADFRGSVFRLSGGQIDLDYRSHDLPPITAGFKRWEGGNGIFLEPAALEGDGLSKVHGDTDYVFAVSGETDPGLGPLPTINPCGGTNWQEQGGFGGTAYTWFSSSCATSDRFLRHMLHQTYYALRDVTRHDNVYADRYPQCGRGDPDPERWFPRPDDCAVDPDVSSCGDPQCANGDAFLAHIFDAHWPDEPGVIGNHCRNAVQDFDETSIDQGGICDRIGR
jgi:hypothetical protein